LSVRCPRWPVARAAEPASATVAQHRPASCWPGGVAFDGACAVATAPAVHGEAAMGMGGRAGNLQPACAARVMRSHRLAYRQVRAPDRTRLSLPRTAIT